MPSKIIDRVFTGLALLAVPVLCMSLWHLGSATVDQYHDHVEHRSLKTLVDSVIATGGRRVVFGGSSSARTYLEIVDYQCPYCRRADSVLRQQVSTSHDVRIMALQLPLSSIHPLAERAAIAAACSGKQGVFATFHHTLYSRGIPTRADSLWQLAAMSGARDSAAFVRCLNDPSARQDVEQDEAIAKRLRVVGTPTFIDSDGNQVPLQTLVKSSVDEGK